MKTLVFKGCVSIFFISLYICPFKNILVINKCCYELKLINMRRLLTLLSLLFLLASCQDTKEEKNLKYGWNTLPDKLLQAHLSAQTVDFYGFRLGMGVDELEKALEKSNGNVSDPGIINYYKFEAYKDNFVKEGNSPASSMFGGSSITIDFDSSISDYGEYKPSTILIDMCRGRVNSIVVWSYGPKQDIEELKKQFYLDAKYGDIKIKRIFKSSLLYGRYKSHSHVYSPTYSLSYDKRNPDGSISEYKTSKSEEFSTNVGCHFWWDNKQSEFVYYNI